jgi:hypothetical protein
MTPAFGVVALVATTILVLFLRGARPAARLGGAGVVSHG